MKNMKIKSKLLILVVFMLVCMGGLGAGAVVVMDKINDGSTVITENWMPSVIAAEELNNLTSVYRIMEYKLILEQDAGELKSIAEQITNQSSSIDAKFDEYMLLVAADIEQEKIDNAKINWKNYQKVAESVYAYALNNETMEALAIMKGESLELFNSVTEAFQQLVTYNVEGGDAASVAGDTLFAVSLVIIVIAILVIIVASLVAALYIISTIAKPVHEIDRVAQYIADGKLDESITYESQDELGKLAVNFNKTVSRLRDYVNYIDEISNVLKEIAGGNLQFTLTYDYFGEFAKVKEALDNISDSLNNTMGNINEASNQVASGSAQMADSAQGLAEGAMDQAGAVEELQATISDVLEQVRTNSNQSREVNAKTNEVRIEAETGNKQMQDMTEAMIRISDTSRQIQNIIEEIEDIASQTNLLSLNASIEAARAGEAGKGFAVVADQIGKLASDSAASAVNTRRLIETAIQEVTKGNQLTERTAQALDKVKEGLVDISEKVNKTAVSSEKQEVAMEQIEQGIEQISSVVQNNSAAAQETSATSEELSAQAVTLSDLVGQFKLKV